ncbi:MAG: bifunctional UDP-N-acetylglucosamine diphosphorylase/glucosamine-1-phosphate N-acetyltransferase GlmU, partial [Parcubacteria group bacterium SW_6_46_9]
MLDLQIIILAAGEGTRMGADKPKVLVDMNDKPLIVHLLTELKKTDLTYSPIIVVGHQAENVQKTLGDEYKYVLQTNQRGTAHATLQAKDVTQKRDPQAMLVLYGDMPLVKSETIESIYNTHCDNQDKITMATTDVGDFS